MNHFRDHSLLARSANRPDLSWPTWADADAVSIAVPLEEVRSRGDRLHPFWVKIEMPANRVNMANR